MTICLQFMFEQNGKAWRTHTNTHAQRKSACPPVLLFISVWIRLFRQLLIVVNSHSADYRCHTTANLLFLFWCCGRVICMSSFYLVFGLINESHYVRRICARLFDAAIIVMVCNHSSWSEYYTYGLGGCAYPSDNICMASGYRVQETKGDRDRRRKNKHLNISVLSANILLRPFSASDLLLL